MSGATSGRPQWFKPDKSGNLATGAVAGDPALVFDWEKLGIEATGLRFVLINTGEADLIMTPEAAYQADGPAEAGLYAPKPTTVKPGECYGDPYGVDEMRPYWRLWVSGTGTFKWGVLVIPR